MAVEAAASRNGQFDEYIEAYETVRARDGQVDLADFLPPQQDPLYQLVLRELVRIDLEYGWRRGRPSSLEHYQSRFPELFQEPASLGAITFEEYRLRRQLGEDPSPSEYRQRWGVNVEEWPTAAPDLAGDSGNNSIPQPPGPQPLPAALPFLADDTAFPAVGTEFLDFQLLAQLGQGSFGRVYLAKQKGLAGRPVVLKISATYTVEVDNLAQVQHTNIIPIYSVHQSGAFQAICMPYLGSATLADVLAALRGLQTLPHSGKALVETAQGCTSTCRQELGASRSAAGENDVRNSPAPRAAPPIAWKQLEPLSYVQAVLWLASRLAAGLAHAHERGILHRDLKPANVLLTDDGQPMLLDFNLSGDTKLLSSVSPAAIGGTLPYMAPEHLRAFQQRTASTDPRSDVYSLGIILYELLTGRQPYPIRTGPLNQVVPEMMHDRRATPRLRLWNKTVSPAVESIVRHCLEPRPEDRYQSARALQEDLERQLAYRLLRHAPERSIRERLAKAVRRNPRSAVAATLLLATLLIAALATLVGLRSRQLARWEAAALCADYRDDVQKARIRLVTTRPTDADQLHAGIVSAHNALDRFGVCDKPAWWEAPPIRTLPLADQEQLREETSELLVLLASVVRAEAELGALHPRRDGLRSALEFNRLAETCCIEGRVPLMLRHQRDTIHRLLDPALHPTSVSDLPPSAVPTARDSCMLAQELMEKGRFEEAGALWRQATRQDPEVLWGWAGIAAYYEHREQYERAAAAYSTCVALMPSFSWLYFKRGTAYLRSKNYAEARADLDAFLRAQPEAKEGYINRALDLQGLDEHERAIDDLTRAIALGTTQTRVYFLRSLSYARLGNAGAARADREKGLELQPSDELSWVVRGAEKLSTNPGAALADFEAALLANPRSRDGLQNKASVLSEQLGRTAEAVAVLDREIGLYPDYVPARAGRGVLLARLGERAAAIRDAEECLRRDIQPAIVYQVAGVYALTSRQRPDDKQQAFLLLNCALDKGYGADLLSIDPDLKPIHEDPAFHRLLAKAKLLKGKQ
jgi:serine/threonine protein kinase/Tfp pilus assembly protein PilF